MKRIPAITAFLLITATIIFSGCASSKKGSCGCPNKQGMVGYK